MSGLFLETPKQKITLEDFKEALGLVVREDPDLMDYIAVDSPSSVKSSQSAYRDVPKIIYSDQTKKLSTEGGATRKKTAKPKAVRRLLQESPTKKSLASTVKKGLPKAGTSGVKSAKKASPHFPISMSHIKIYGTNYVKHNFEHEVMGINDFLMLSARDIRVSKSTFQS